MKERKTKRKRIQKIDDQEYGYAYIISLFSFLIIFRIFLMILQDIKLFKFFDIFTVSSVFISSISTTNPLFTLIICALGGLVEDVTSGSTLGLNLLTKSTVSFLIISIRNKMEIGNILLLIPFVIAATMFDIVVKYVYITAFLNIQIAYQILVAELFFKNIANVVTLIILNIITRR